MRLPAKRAGPSWTALSTERLEEESSRKRICTDKLGADSAIATCGNGYNPRLAAGAA